MRRNKILKLVVIFFIFLTAFSFSIAYAANSAPNVNSVNVAVTSGGPDISNFNLTSGTVTRLFVHGDAVDNDGCEDMDTASNWRFVVHRSDVPGLENCFFDKNSCYQAQLSSISFSNCTGPGDLDIDYEAYVDISYFADPTDEGSPFAAVTWTAFVEAGDEGVPSLKGVSTDSFEMNSLLSADVSTVINYGELGLNSDSPQRIVTFTNLGNRGVDVDQSADGDMVCDGAGSPVIPVGNVHISKINGFTYGTDDQALSISPVHFDLSLPPQTDDFQQSLQDAYLILRVPETDVGGTCSNDITFTVKADI